MPRKDRLKKQFDSKQYNCNQYPKGWKHCRQTKTKTIWAIISTKTLLL
jgi:hypothetical protein